MDNIRIVEFPKCRMASSGCAREEDPFGEGSLLNRFDSWWSEYDKGRKDRWFSRDFIMYNREENALIWYYALPDGADPQCEFEIVDFEGGLYAAAVSVDGDDEDGQRVYGEIKKWVEASPGFQLDEREGHYDLCTVITPKSAEKAMGYLQLEIYVPIKVKE